MSSSEDGQRRAGGASAPAITLPTGGGAIRGMGEKFAANPSTGTGSVTIPIATSATRGEFGPQLVLGYQSGAGNGPFGLGWNLSLPAITRQSDKGLPRYQDEAESDVFQLAGAEDLVPAGDESERDGHRIQRYRPRVEGLFARIERWTHVLTGETHWRSITKDNVTTLYGQTNNSRVFDPDDPDPAHPNRIYTWLVCASYDDKGNAIHYGYAEEDADNVDDALPSERHRRRTANRYLKWIRYGNRVPNRDSDWRATDPALLPAATWMFEVVCDYGEGHYAQDSPDVRGRVFARAWREPSGTQGRPVRADSFSSYRAGFEVRTHRLCRRLLMFHHFPGELGVDDCLVSATEFAYAEGPVASLLTGITQSGYVRAATGGVPNRYLCRSFPPMEFEYSQVPSAPELAQRPVREVDPLTLENLPAGLQGNTYQWIDLDGEGSSGVLSEQANGWYYKRNLSANQSGTARLGAAQLVASRPVAGLADRHQFLDLVGDGQLDLVRLNGPESGFYERTGDGWAPWQSFTSAPEVSTVDPDLRFVDLTGDGHADILITTDDGMVWFPSLGEAGYGQAGRASVPWDEQDGPRLAFSDPTGSVYLADMSGDGLNDLVRIGNGSVCYWPNLGYGRFGAKVTMHNAPWFDRDELFDQRRIRLGDSDGSGTTDIFYFGADGARLFPNHSGNGWGAPVSLPQFPPVDSTCAVELLDLLGTGTACLTWSSPLPGSAGRQMRYLALLDEKPHLLTRMRNGRGGETSIRYAPSTKFYADDLAAGRPWITRLPYPVHVVERVQNDDRVSRTRFVTRYAYHHGYFDGVEREFRAFGMVEQWDTEELAALTEDGTLPAANLDPASHVPPVLTRTWFHTGIHIGGHISNFFAGLLGPHDKGEYYREAGLTDGEARQLLLDDTILPVGLSAAEEREACRALKGSLLRQETYALDGTARQAHPYSVTEQSYGIRVLQRQGGNRHAVFLSHQHESISYHYERDPADPRVQHMLTLEVDEFGNVLKSVAAGYGRRASVRVVGDDATVTLVPNPGLAQLDPVDRDKQIRALVVSTDDRFTNAVDLPDAHRTPQPAQTIKHELTGYTPTGPAGRYRPSDFVSPGGAFVFDTEIPYDQAPSGGRQRRLIEHTRTRYRRDDLSMLLPLGGLEPMALQGESWRLALTPGLVSQVYQPALLPDPAGVLAAAGGAGAGYTDLDGDGLWWVPSGRGFFSPGSGDTPATELAFARQHFFLGHRFRDSFQAESLVTFDSHHLLMTQTVDALGNRVIAGQRLADGGVSNGNDYRVLQPRLVTDANRNRSAAAFDALGLVVGTALSGKPEEPIGDTLDGFAADLTDATVVADLQNPLADPHAVLGRATTRLVYDMWSYHRTRNQPEPTPITVHVLSRETHDSDLQTGQATKVQHSFGYCDGQGREIQKKIQAESGSGPRWVGSGWTVLNNKGKPVRRFEAFFSGTHRFEFDVKAGVSAVLCYDPLGRVVATLHPNHTWEKAVFDPWRQVRFDTSDTVLSNPDTDTDVRPYLSRLPADTYLPTWYGLRTDPANAAAFGARYPVAADRAAELVAATRSAVHAGSPATAHLDSLGRPFLSVAHNRAKYSDTPLSDPPAEQISRTRVQLDIAGNPRVLLDAMGRVAMRYDYDLLGTRIRQSGLDCGTRVTLVDAARQPLYAWDDLQRRIRTEYDALRRPVATHLRTGTAAEILIARNGYGEDRADPEATNARGRLVQTFDQSGVVTRGAYDFKGNVLDSTRRLATEYATMLDWDQGVPLEAEVFHSRTGYDALNRPTQVVAPHSDQPGARVNVIQPRFNEANLLDRIDVWLDRSSEPTGLLDPATADLPAIAGIDYNAKGQRLSVDYGNGSRTTYVYDPDTLLVTKVRTTRPTSLAPVQDLTYTYDAAANVTAIRNDAEQTVFFQNKKVEPSCDYTYDALFRLIEATGREHLGQAAQPIPHSYHDSERAGLAHPGDGNALGRYLERYRYDAVDNLVEFQHRGTDPANPGWTRAYEYGEESLLEDGVNGNRLTGTTVGATTELYSVGGDGYDRHGHSLRLPHLQEMVWDFRDLLQMTRRQAVNGGGAERTYYVYDHEGVRVRKVTELATGAVKDERVYLGGFEVYRRGGVNPIVRETLHIVDGKHRAALVETRTQGTGTEPPRIVRYQFGDHLGSVGLELDHEAKVLSFEEYTPYGSTTFQAVAAQIEAPKRYRYTGRERDEESGLSYHDARYYAPWLARWVSPDPAAFGDGSAGPDPQGGGRDPSAESAGGRGGGRGARSPGGEAIGIMPPGLADGPNLYAYARCNPVRHRDITGRQASSPAPTTGVEDETPATSPQGKYDFVMADIFQALSALLTFAASILVGALLGGVVGAAIGAAVGFTHALISAVGQDKDVRHSETYKGILEISALFNPMALAGTLIGAVGVAINLLAMIFTLGLVERARMSFGYYKGNLVVNNGLIRPPVAFTAGNIIFMNRDYHAFQDPQLTELILRHERGHSLNNAMFSIFQIEDPFVEWTVGQQYSMFERLAESNVNPNQPLQGGFERKNQRRLEGGRGFGDVPWWNP